MQMLLLLLYGPIQPPVVVLLNGLLQPALYVVPSAFVVANRVVFAMLLDDAMLRRPAETICIYDLRRSCNECCTVFEATVTRSYHVN